MLKLPPENKATARGREGGGERERDRSEEPKVDIPVHRLLMLNEVTRLPIPQTCFMLPPNTTTALCLVSPFGTA